MLSGFLIVKQVEHYLDPQKRLAIAKEFVGTAIHNILANLEHCRKNRKDVAQFIDKLKTSMLPLKKSQIYPNSRASREGHKISIIPLLANF